MLASIDPDVSDNLAFLRTYRNTADYELDVSTETLRIQYEDALDRAGNVLARLDALMPPETEAAVESDPEPDP